MSHVRYGFLQCLIETLSLDVSFQKCCDIENWVRGPSRSLEMLQFDRKHMTAYWRSSKMALSRVVSGILNVKNVVTLKSGSELTQGHWKWWHSLPWYSFLLVFYSNFVPTMRRFWDIRLVIIPWHPGTRVRGHSSHWKWYRLIWHPWLPINVP